MKLAEYFRPGGMGVLATAGNGGAVNTAVYAVPQIIDEETVAWGMTEGRTYRFAKENPHAAYLYFAPGKGMKGIRLTLKLKEIETSGEVLEAVRARAAETVGTKAGAAVKYVAYYKVVETRDLV
ncbi:MAG: pyridoxamine 5'-phosphate oxidase family protein [Deltaproteobacteria bacterium]|nr:pyridoxamine 5'-phosphate oxidase family protein [Deltaproteobacteria bacterium]